MNQQHQPPDTLIILGTCGGSNEVCQIVREYGSSTRVVFVNDIDPIYCVEIGDERFPVVKDWNFAPLRRRVGEFMQFTVGMGNPRAKRIIVAKALAAGLQPSTPVLSLDVVIRPDVQLGRGVAVHPQCFIGSRTRIGDFAVIHKAAVAGDVTIGAYATCAPHSTTGRGAVIGEGVYLGARAAVAPGVSIAPWVQIGLNSAVREDVLEERATLVGNPIRQILRG